MKKLKDLKENECIRISSKREAKKLSTHKLLPLDKASIGKYVGKIDDVFIVTGMPFGTILPASDFMRPSVNEQLRQLSDRVGKLEEQLPQVINNGEGRFTVKFPDGYLDALEVNDPQHVQELTELPEKWAIRCQTEEQSAILKAWANDHNQIESKYYINELLANFFNYPK